MRKTLAILSIAAVVPFGSGAFAQASADAPVTTTAGKDVRLGAYAVFRRDCSGGVAAQVRPAGNQRNGLVVINTGTLATSRLANCGKVESPAQIISYRPNPNFTGTDEVTFDVTDPASGQTQTHTVSVRVLP